MSKITRGQGSDGILLDATVSDTAAHVSSVITLNDTDLIGLQLCADGTLDGAWKIEVSNEYTPTAAGGAAAYGQYVSSPRWANITTSAVWSTTPASVAHGTAATQDQYTQATLSARSLRVTFTATTGTGRVSVIALAKSI